MENQPIFSWIFVKILSPISSRKDTRTNVVLPTVHAKIIVRCGCMPK